MWNELVGGLALTSFTVGFARATNDKNVVEGWLLPGVSQGAERKTAREKDLKHERLEEARSKASICYFLMAVLSLSTGIQPGIIFFFMEVEVCNLRRSI